MTRLICAISRSINPVRPVRTPCDPAKRLHENIAWQLPPQPPTYLLIGDLRLEFRIKVANLSRKQNEMQQHVGMHDQENGWPERKEAEERQIHVEEWQLDPAL